MNNQKNNITYKNSYFNVCKNLILSDLIIFKQMFIDKFIDVTIWVILTIFVTGYIMPSFGLQADFGVFQFGGILAAVGLFELYSSVVDFVSDLQGDRVIDYNLTLPIPSWLAIASKAGYFFIIYFLLSLALLPVGKVCLWNQLDLMKIDYIKLLLAIIVQNIFYACFAIWAASVIDNMSKLGRVWSRFIFPMWFMGGFQFSWFSLYSVVPLIAWINLINPMIYVTEAMRVALLGQADYLNFWLCLATITIFSIIILLAGLRNLKKRLDFVI
ncbi:ABC transporter permease [Candidatus Babeliales bacterium]|nr:ABC transporter permease [Candidatus Babeliales bacterium]MBP9844042.1 ABC transporter permease [Candidatus Babeliales bacterium]